MSASRTIVHTCTPDVEAIRRLNWVKIPPLEFIENADNAIATNIQSTKYSALLPVFNLRFRLPGQTQRTGEGQNIFTPPRVKQSANQPKVYPIVNADAIGINWGINTAVP
jgi:hypothetical protein